ncbi:NAD(P)-binding domain-containing protein [Rozella allomycis CSF55]|uniref:NAD(P)-binding domain-containing protein n=1 Tax=Rozella allomycis (strain CSF55) TaxID=988480 RepID=A0A075AUN0_ROZAC|nr:NAD(P)-binding domain-containing protein [Rozella allomycis CSF55]|eukprot:EPZ33996.1 NAD(P)-binding domain-containing protein [Rozella allomycis CSF55]
MPVVFVTGANRGIGLEFARQYLHQGYKVFGTSRAPYSNVKELSEIISKDCHLVLDVSNADSIAELASNFSKKDIKIDLLINNSGIFLKSDFTTKEKDMAEACMEQFKVNAMGPLLVTQSLLPFMNEGCKVINITSRMGSIEDNTSGGYYGYRMSKASLNMVTKSLAIDLMKYKIKVLALHPGYIRTDMTGGQGDMDPREAVEKMIHVIDDLSEDISGGFYHRDGYKLPY